MAGRIRVGIGICVGLMIAAVAFMLLYPARFSEMAREGRNAGFEVDSYVSVRTLEERAEKQKSLSASEVKALDGLASNKDARVRARALTALFFLGNTPQAGEAARIARTKLSDPEPMVRQYALSALDHLKTSDRMDVARTLLNDPAENVRAKASKVLAKR